MLLTPSGVQIVAQDSVSSAGKTVHKHSMSFIVSCVESAVKCLSVSRCVDAMSSKKPRGMSVSPCVENALSVNASRLGRGVRRRIHGQSCGKPWTCTELVRTVSSRRSDAGTSS